MLTALLLGLVGGADLLRTHLARRAAAATVIALWSVALAAALVGLGAPLLGVVVVAALGGAWLLLTTTAEGRRPPGGLKPAAGLVVAVLLLSVADRSGGAATGPLVDVYTALGRSDPVPPVDQALMALGAAVFLLESGNVIVRAALYRELAQPEGPPPRRLPLRARLSRPPAEEVRLPDLRGGRAIGPLERMLVAGLTLAGAVGLAGAVFAAKGIVRFPEISRDGASGAKAEYFLVGSLVSWTLALSCAALVAFA
ncbi:MULTISPECIES: hypothetical protein [unclassified Rathayibacter]|uniref:hypothetical protein n=1 Tax=unclassified Rathayibacter TaxID=2609250 RepID=UPI000700E027|nr:MULTISPECIES: hypothetical protein [unclassified Rathayibacter]KQQ01333.1 hypothetical protein ASF42_12655 [Rathayibacter sp. Leaf294]KQS11364.1 hypothetical protein ASG06_12655 [Rathayibacter sp. Leaf185]